MSPLPTFETLRRLCKAKEVLKKNPPAATYKYFVDEQLPFLWNEAWRITKGGALARSAIENRKGVEYSIDMQTKTSPTEENPRNQRKAKPVIYNGN